MGGAAAHDAGNLGNVGNSDCDEEDTKGALEQSECREEGGGNRVVVGMTYKSMAISKGLLRRFPSQMPMMITYWRVQTA